MANPYIGQLNPKVGGGLGGLPRRSTGAIRGEITFSVPRAYFWTVPDGVRFIHGVAIGGGGGGYQNIGGFDTGSGAGGELRWVNDIFVTPGDILTITVGKGGEGIVSTVTLLGVSGGFSRVVLDGSTVLRANGGGGGEPDAVSTGGNGGTGDGGGDGGDGAFLLNGVGTTDNASSGGGSGGYSGDGGDGVSAIRTSAPVSGNSGSGGAAASGTVLQLTETAGGQGGGGTGVFGEGNSGSSSGDNGSGGADAVDSANNKAATSGGVYGGGGGASFGNTNISSQEMAMDGGHGCVRIIWGEGREFPATDVGQS